MNDFDFKLCDIKGTQFALFGKNEIQSTAFILVFMHSDTAKALDSTYNHAQWMGEEYLLDEICENDLNKH